MFLDGYALPGFSFGVWPGQAGKRNSFAKWQNQVQFQDTFTNYTEIMLNMFEWTGLPETCNPRYLEQTLYFYGKAIFFKDESLGFLHTPVQLGEGQNIYGEHVHMQAYSFNYNKTYTIDNSVLIRATPTLWPMYLTASIYAAKVSDAARAIDVVAQTYKRPFLISTTDDQKLTYQHIIDQATDNEIGLFVNKSALDVNNIGVFPTPPTNSKLIEMWEHRQNWQNEILTRMGIMTANTDKRERLISAEVNSNNQYTILNSNILLESRMKSCEAINKMFNLNVSVKLKEDYNLKEMLSESEEEQNEQIHDNPKTTS